MAKETNPDAAISAQIQEGRPLDEQADERRAWASVSSVASQSISFWNSFLGLRTGADPLAGRDIDRLLCIVRAVSWVESRHGTGQGSSAAADPMQCGHPADSWWRELTDCRIQQDRFVGGPGRPNYDACQLPAAAASSAGFPDAAKLATLQDPRQGHSNRAFGQTMSYYWGVPILIHKTNTGAGDRTYQCGDLGRDRLIDGAVAYNGGGVADYQARIEAALALSGCL